MRALLRLVLWGTGAAGALALAVVAASSGTGSQRLLAALNGRGPLASTQQLAQAPSAQPTSPQLAARATEAENERRRLAESVRALSADRDRLLARMASLEHSLQDVTGSIKRQTPAPSLAPAVSNEPAPAAAAAAPAASASSPAPATAPAATSHLANRQAPEEAAEEAKPEFAIDIGGAVNFDGLRALWKSLHGAHGALLEDMHPLVIARENSRTRGVELRLIAGPVADAEAAARICATLAAARRFCHPAEFEGQKLTLVAPEPERRPATATPKASPAPAVRPAPKR